jgi:hypothetical protein
MGVQVGDTVVFARDGLHFAITGAGSFRRTHACAVMMMFMLVGVLIVMLLAFFGDGIGRDTSRAIEKKSMIAMTMARVSASMLATIDGRFAPFPILGKASG